MTTTSSPVRFLSLSEREVIPDIIQRTLDLDIVEIHKRRWTFLTPDNVTVVRGHKIFYPRDPGPNDSLYHLAHLVHEIVHVWQYLYMGIGLYSPRWLDRRYKYTIHPEKRFGAYGLEQQAAIFEDAFRLANDLPFRWAQNEPSAEALQKVLKTCEEDFDVRS